MVNYTISTEKVHYRGRDFELIRPEDPCELINETSTDEDAPYWAEEWPSSEIALRTLPELITDPSEQILEIGAGAGTVSIRLNSLFPKYIACDYFEDACVSMEQNRQLNDGSLIPVVIDWNKSPFKKEFETIIGIDILYEESMIEPIGIFFKDHLTPNGRAYLFDPQRFFWKKFQESLPSLGLEIESSLIEKSTEGINVEMLVIRRK